MAALFPKFFSPNGDGRNDTYRVKGANKTFYPNSSINIFNRYGKLVAQIPIDSQGWNGIYNGKKLSSDDYWYNIKLIPADNTKQILNKIGNFSLLRKQFIYKNLLKVLQRGFIKELTKFIKPLYPQE